MYEGDALGTLLAEQTLAFVIQELVVKFWYITLHF